jgi:hypothetical protein
LNNALSHILSKLPDAKETANGWQARCPAHDDTNASLSISSGEDGRVLLCCHAGCSIDSICSSLGVDKKELFHGEHTRATLPTYSKLIATYDYKTAEGKLAFQVCRYKPKSFRQRRPDGHGGWIWDTNGVERVLFRLPELIAAVKNDVPVFVCEGEKDCLSMAQKGFTATCNAGGACSPSKAKSWPSKCNDHFRGALVCIIPDRDTPGCAHAQFVASQLVGIAKVIRIVELPDVGDHQVKDAADYFAAGGTREGLIELIDTVADWTPPATESDSAPSITFIDAAAAIANPEPLPPVLIDGLLHRGEKLVLGGGSKSFKTWCLCDLALSVATGTPFWGMNTAPGKVLYLNFEVQGCFFARRIQTVAQAKQIVIPPGVLSIANLRGQNAKDILIQVARQAKGQSLIIVDPIYKLMQGRDDC